MSQENVEIVRQGLDTWNEGDMDAYRELLDVEVITHPPEGWPEPGPFVGREAAIREFEYIREAFNLDAVEAVGEIIEVGDRVIVRLVWRAIGRGPDISMEMTCIYTVRDRKMVDMEFFRDHPEALKAVGLSE